MTVRARPVTGARRAAAADLDDVVEVLVASHDDFVWERWALPHPDRRQRLADLYRCDVGTVALEVGEVWITDCGRSVAVWLPAGAHESLAASALDELDSAARSAFGDHLAIIGEVDRVIADARPSHDWYLATMGTLPSAERQGLGTAVLQPRLAALEQVGGIAALETSEPGNLPFYRRLGFEVVAELRHLPHGAPFTWVMRRLSA